VISANEIANASAALLKLDKNHDGQLTPDELHPPRPQKQDASSSSSSSTTEPPPLPEGEGNGPEGERPHPKFPLMEALDADHDGTLSADEIKNAPEALKTLDKNGDGKLTPDEFAPPRPPKGEGSGELMPMPTPSES
jgi:Ca2+-binding EF-hand superfamily protein